MNDNIKGAQASLDDYFSVIFSDITLESYFDGPVEVIKGTPKKEWNETERWLYDSTCSNYERVAKLVMSKTPYSQRFSLPPDEIESYFHSFLYDHLIPKNQLKSEIDKGKKIKPSVIYEWYIQFVVREKFIEGQDALQRTRGAKTQSEVMKIKAYEEKETDKPYAPSHNIKNLTSNGFSVAEVVNKLDEETGQAVGEPDYYFTDDSFADLEEQSENEYMKELLLDRFGTEKVDMYYSLWLELRYAHYENKKAWCEARKVSYKVLTAQIEQVQNVFKDNLEDFGY